MSQQPLLWACENGVCVECQRRHHPGRGCPRARRLRTKAEALAQIRAGDLVRTSALEGR